MRVIPQKFIANDGTEWLDEATCKAHEAELVRLGMEQWDFSFVYRRDLKSEFTPTYKKCPSCHGTLKVGGGFGDPDGPRDCDTCWGSGIVIDQRPKHVEAPPIPDSLNKAMTKTWADWWKNYRA